MTVKILVAFFFLLYEISHGLCMTSMNVRNKYQLTIQLQSINLVSENLLENTSSPCSSCGGEPTGNLTCSFSLWYCIRPRNAKVSDVPSDRIERRCANKTGHLKYSLVYSNTCSANFEEANDPTQTNTISLPEPQRGFQIYMVVQRKPRDIEEETVYQGDNRIEKFVFNKRIRTGKDFRVDNQLGLMKKARLTMAIDVTCLESYSGYYCMLSPSQVGGIFLGLMTFVILATTLLVLVIVCSLYNLRKRRQLRKLLAAKGGNSSSDQLLSNYQNMHTLDISNRNISRSTLSPDNNENLFPGLMVVTKMRGSDSGYDYAEPDHLVVSTRQESNNYNSLSHYWSPSGEREKLQDELRHLKLKNFSEDELEFLGVLGSGEFSQVYKALWHDENSKTMLVAVKATKDGATDEEKIKFLQEAAVMGRFNHPYIVTIFGVMVNPEKHHIIVELMSGSCLLNHLENTEKYQCRLKLGSELLCFSKQIANGMSYLELRGFIHRDLACRNVLLNRHSICKIADFGLSRELKKENCYISIKGGKIPLKWTAPEAILYQRWSSASDVWSYGITLFEIWSLGAKPYEKLSVNEYMTQVSGGYRLPPSPGCPHDIYSLMMLCWHPEPEMRPKFTEIVTILNRPEYKILSWSDVEKKNYSKEARALGSSLPSGKNLFPDIQQRYISSSKTGGAAIPTNSQDL